jgi:dienelactone hydrolase
MTRCFRVSRLLAVALLALVCLPAAAAAQSGPVGSPEGRWRAQLHRVPFDAGGGTLIVTRVCRPPGEARAPLVVINHGSPANTAERARWATPTCGAVAQWFVRRGYVVALPLRRGYGETGGTWAEGYGPCNFADFVAGGLGSAADIDAAVRYMRTLPYVATDRLVVVGQSAGGWAALAYASRHPDGLVAVLNFAGGRGGHRDNVPNSNCSGDRLVAAAGTFGRTAGVPTLWVYAANDSFFAPELVQRMHAAFTGAGGRAQLVQPGPYSTDGHNLFSTAGLPVWGPIAASFLDAAR